jgi:hypothetical protein
LVRSFQDKRVDTQSLEHCRHREASRPGARNDDLLRVHDSTISGGCSLPWRAARRSGAAANPPEGAFLELGDVLMLALEVRESVLRMPCRKVALERRVGGRLVAVGTKEVAQHQMAELVVTSGLADMQVMRPGPLRRLGEEVTYTARGSMAPTES